VPLAVTLSNSPSEPVSATLTGLPSGITVSPLTLTGGGSGTLTLSASLSAGQEGFNPTLLSIPTSWTVPVTVVAAAGAFQTTFPISITVSISNPSFAPAASAINLPIVTINTNGVPIQDKTTDVPGTITITSADGQTSYLPNSSDSDNTGTFHLHGNSTTMMPKLPYHVKLTTSLDLLNQMGLSCPYVTNTKGKAACDKSKSFILLANYDDKTFLRDWSASALANAIPIGGQYLNSPANSPSPGGSTALMPWAPHSLFVELYLNGVYEGNYQLIEEVKVDSHRVNITELTETDTSATQVTGGYLMEIDQRQDEAFVFVTPQSVDIGLIDPDFTPDPEVPEQTSYISNYLNSAEGALFAANFTDPVLGWRAYFDEASAVNFFIVNEVMGNLDGGQFFSSDYLYKDYNNPLIYMGPVWDFDVSSGNVNYAPIVDPTISWMQTNAPWYIQWFGDPGFRADVTTQWNTLKKNGVFAAWLASIQQEASILEQSQVNNLGRWPMQGIEVWPNPEAAGSYAGEVSYLIDWLNLRIAFMDSLYNKKTLTTTTFSAPTGPLSSGSPVVLTAQVSGGTNPTGTVSFLCSGVLLTSVPLSRSGIASATVNNLPAGAGNLRAVYSGDSVNALSNSVTETVNVAAPLAPTVISIGSVREGGDRNRPIASFAATVIGNSGTAVPTGTVSCSADLTSVSKVTLNGSGQANCSFGGLAPGPHTVTAVYSGDAVYTASSASMLFDAANVSPVSGPKDR
jgi:hypothetical protein